MGMGPQILAHLGVGKKVINQGNISGFGIITPLGNESKRVQFYRFTMFYPFFSPEMDGLRHGFSPTLLTHGHLKAWTSWLLYQLPESRGS
jgi:hypothetical protein